MRDLPCGACVGDPGLAIHALDCVRLPDRFRSCANYPAYEKIEKPDPDDETGYLDLVERLTWFAWGKPTV